MSRTSRPALRAAAPLLGAVLLLTACGGGGSSAATPSVDPTAAQLEQQLDVLPSVDGATRTARTLDGSTLTESFTVPTGTPACLQLLSRLDASGYQVVAGSDPVGPAVDPGTCRTATGTAGVDASAGAATILARGGSVIGLTWTATAYTLRVSE